MTKHILCATVLLTAFCICPVGLSNEPPLKLDPIDLSGPYEVELGDWEPALELGADIQYFTPPHQISLSTEKAPGPKPEDQSVRLIKPFPDGSKVIHSYSYWEIRKDGKIDICFSTEYGGIYMTVTISGERLVGTAETFWEFPRQTHRAKVQLKRVH